MTDPSAVSLCGMQSASATPPTHTHIHYFKPQSELLVVLCQDQLSFKVIYLHLEKTSTRFHWEHVNHTQRVLPECVQQATAGSVTRGLRMFMLLCVWFRRRPTECPVKKRGSFLKESQAPSSWVARGGEGRCILALGGNKFRDSSKPCRKCLSWVKPKYQGLCCFILSYEPVPAWNCRTWRRRRIHLLTGQPSCPQWKWTFQRLWPLLVSVDDQGTYVLLCCWQLAALRCITTTFWVGVCSILHFCFCRFSTHPLMKLMLTQFPFGSVWHLVLTANQNLSLTIFGLKNYWEVQMKSQQPKKEKLAV